MEIISNHVLSWRCLLSDGLCFVFDAFGVKNACLSLYLRRKIPGVVLAVL